MKLAEIKEFHYITHINNLKSICEKGILSYNLANKFDHTSIAMQEVQNRRENKQVPGGRSLHEYVNLYFCARNPMLYLRRNLHSEICILRVSPKIVYIKGAIVADRNASSDYVRFYPSPEGIENIDKDLVFAEYWTHPDNIFFECKHKSIKCAEILIPDRVNPNFIEGLYVSEAKIRNIIRKMGISLPIEVNPHLFFR
ncbi:DUF4433 domain-containing protein [Thermoanaerobacterium sp. DL9XJH110]|uniref:DUF4433 domain-containing protein n=1 Tax=Thermoanaerobacterium sp. DL9XJH110 TaxID=3386643 RepID=UPI003BB6C52B